MHNGSLMPGGEITCHDKIAIGTKSHTKRSTGHGELVFKILCR